MSSKSEQYLCEALFLLGYARSVSFADNGVAAGLLRKEIDEFLEESGVMGIELAPIDA